MSSANGATAFLWKHPGRIGPGYRGGTNGGIGLNQAERLAVGSVAIGVLVLGLKGLAWWVTGSAALYSDALETVVNVLASAIAFAALRVAARPADANHPYGHDKAEFFSAVIEGALVVLAAVLILEKAWEDLLHPHPLAMPWSGIGLNAIATIANGAWGLTLLRAGRRMRSPALEGDARHLLADVATSVGITAGLTLAVLTGRLLLDPLLAALTAAYVLWSGTRIIGASVGGLMDEAAPPAMVDRIRALVARYGAGAIEAHDLRTRHAGRLTFLEFHLVVPGNMRVADAHDICDRIEAALKREMDGLMITIHVEPEGKLKHEGVQLR